MGRVQINAPAAGSAGEGPVVTGAPYSESATFLLNPPPMKAAPSVTIKPSFALRNGDYISVTVQGTAGAATLYGGAVIYIPGSGNIGSVQINVNGNGAVVSVPGQFATSNAIVTVTFYRYSQM